MATSEEKSEARRRARTARRKAREQFQHDLARLRESDPAAVEAFLLAGFRADPGNRSALGLLLGGERERPTSDAEHSALVARAAVAGAEAIDLARAAVSAAARQATDEALPLALAAIDRADGEVRTALRDASAWAFDWHGLAEAARAIAFHLVPADELPRAFGRLGRVRSSSRFDRETDMLLELGCQPDNPEADVTVVARLRYLWRATGPTDVLVDLGRAWMKRHPSAAPRLAGECIALLLELGRVDDAAAMLRADVASQARFNEILPIAWLLREMGIPAHLPADEVSAAAALFDSFAAGEKLLSELLDPALSLAVVGNSPCELGLGKGPTIDAADTVVRFNRGVPTDATGPDYGSRTTIHVLPVRKASRDHAPAHDARLVVYALPSARYTNRDWQEASAHCRDGRAITGLSGDGYRALAERLKAPPSAGLRFLREALDRRGALGSAELFGFSFVDQIGPQASSSHFFETSVPSMHHAWTTEATVVAEMLGPARR